jgi:hypothetical protein
MAEVRWSPRFSPKNDARKNPGTMGLARAKVVFLKHQLILLRLCLGGLRLHGAPSQTVKMGSWWRSPLSTSNGEAEPRNRGSIRLCPPSPRAPMSTTMAEDPVETERGATGRSEAGRRRSGCGAAGWTGGDAAWRRRELWEAGSGVRGCRAASGARGGVERGLLRRPPTGISGGTGWGMALVREDSREEEKNAGKNKK